MCSSFVVFCSGALRSLLRALILTCFCAFTANHPWTLSNIVSWNRVGTPAAVAGARQELTAAPSADATRAQQQPAASATPGAFVAQQKPSPSPLEGVTRHEGPVGAEKSTGALSTCTCKNSQCIKLYCTCFAANRLCVDKCACRSCRNNNEFADERKAAAEAVFQRKRKAGTETEGQSEPGAFHGSDREAYAKGCTCQKSGCLKRYCQCFSAGIQCSNFCSCKTCNNCEERTNLTGGKAPGAGAADENGREAISRVGLAGQDDSNREGRTCTCKQSQCLKLYCVCFAANGMCAKGCTCRSCQNNDKFLVKRNAAIVAMLETNPAAFEPKATESAKPAKGCFCEKSGCRKRYCDCFNAGVRCSDICRCKTCKNVDGSDGAPPGVEDANSGVGANAARRGSPADEEPSGAELRTCTCKNSHCLKRYCVCFAANGMCGKRCSCWSCRNNDQFPEERNAAVKMVIALRGPSGFRPNGDDAKHINGCSCKKSGCVKGYCECFSAGIPCSGRCRCVTCENADGVDGPTAEGERHANPTGVVAPSVGDVASKDRSPTRKRAGLAPGIGAVACEHSKGKRKRVTRQSG